MASGSCHRSLCSLNFCALPNLSWRAPSPANQRIISQVAYRRNSSHVTRQRKLSRLSSGIVRRRSLFTSSYVPQALSKSWTNNAICRIDSTTVFSQPSRSYNVYPIPETIPDKAQVVVSGGGIIGCSVAYHLAQRGCTDVVLLEQGSLGCGTTWHAAGLLGQLKNCNTETLLCQYTSDLLTQLQDEGHAIGFKKCGSLNLARTKDRMIHFRRQEARAKTLGIECSLITPREVKDIVSMIKYDDLEGALWVPNDGYASPTDITVTLAKLARQMGVTIVEGCKIEKINVEKYKIKGVETSRGPIACKYFVNCSGQWARDVGKLSQPPVRVPLHSCEHYYLLTKPLQNEPLNIPVIRDYDGMVYFRDWSGGIMAGGFEKKAKPVFHTGIPDRFEFQLLPEDWDHFQVLLDEILHRMPILDTAQILQLTNGPESFTPDSRWILGESPEVDNYFVAAGMNSSGIVGSGGVGKYLAEWILDGKPSVDLWSLDVRRFVDLHNNKKFLRDRVKETLGCVYSLRYPYEAFRTGRRLRTSPLHTRLQVANAHHWETNAYERPVWFTNDGGSHARLTYPSQEYSSSTRLRTSVLHTNLLDNGAVCYQRMAYERPLYFATAEDMLSKRPRGTFSKPPWFDIVETEYWACKEGVCLIDMSSFSKFEIKSRNRESVDYFQYLCSNDAEQPKGTVVHTGMQNVDGGYENDCSIVRLDDFYYFMISPTVQQTRSLSWLHRNLPANSSVQIRDVTSMYSGINVVGPRAQDLLAELTDTSMNKADFPMMTCKQIDVGHASGIRALRLTHSGEDGFTLYIPSEYTLHVYDALLQAGKDYGIRNAGYYAMRCLRIEKFFAYWGLDLNTHTTPFECGRDFRVKFDQGDFIGKDALLRQKEVGIGQKFVHFTLESHDVHSDLWPWGGEPIYRNGRFVGNTTSSGYGYSLGKMVCLGFVRDYEEATNIPIVKKNMNEFVLDRNAHYEIDIAGQRFTAKAGIHTPRAALTSVDSSYIPVPARTTSGTYV